MSELLSAEQSVRVALQVLELTEGLPGCAPKMICSEVFLFFYFLRCSFAIVAQAEVQ